MSICSAAAAALLEPVLAVARLAVLALALPAPVLAVTRAAVPALALPAPVLAQSCLRWGALIRNPARATAKPNDLLAVASTAACIRRRLNPVVGGSAGTKRRAAAILSGFGLRVQSETWCSPLPFGEVSEQRLLPPLLGGGRAKGQEGAGARASGPALRRGWSWTRWCLARLGNDGGSAGKRQKWQE
jgi:hypothetical protein